MHQRFGSKRHSHGWGRPTLGVLAALTLSLAGLSAVAVLGPATPAGAFPSSDTMSMGCVVSSGSQAASLSATVALGSPTSVAVGASIAVPVTLSVTIPGSLTSQITSPLEVDSGTMNVDATDNPTVDGAASPVVQTATEPSTLAASQSFPVTSGSPLVMNLPMSNALFTTSNPGTVYFAPHSGTPYPPVAPTLPTDYAFQASLDYGAVSLVCTAPSGQFTLTQTVASFPPSDTMNLGCVFSSAYGSANFSDTVTLASPAAAVGGSSISVPVTLAVTIPASLTPAIPSPLVVGWLG